MGSLRQAVRESLARLGVILAELGRIQWHSAEAERLYRERRNRSEATGEPAAVAPVSESAATHPGATRRREAATAKKLWAEVDRLVIGGGNR